MPSKRKILVVDDYEDIRQTVGRAFSHAGFEVTTVDNGFDALKELERSLSEQDRYNLVLVDYAMPGMDGLTCAMRFRQMERERGGNPSMLVFYTGHDDLDLSPAIRQQLNVHGSYRKNELVEMVKDLDRVCH